MKFNPRKMQKEFREALDAMEEITSQRNIIAKFYGHTAKHVLHTTRSKHWENAVGNALRHMRRNTHSAFVVIIYDAVTAQLYATITRSVTGAVVVEEYQDEKAQPIVLTDFPEGLLPKEAL